MIEEEQTKTGILMAGKKRVERRKERGTDAGVSRFLGRQKSTRGRKKGTNEGRRAGKQGGSFKEYTRRGSREKKSVTLTWKAKISRQYKDREGKMVHLPIGEKGGSQADPRNEHKQSERKQI